MTVYIIKIRHTNEWNTRAAYGSGHSRRASENESKTVFLAGTSGPGTTKKFIGRSNGKTRAGHAVGKFGVGNDLLYLIDSTDQSAYTAPAKPSRLQFPGQSTPPTAHPRYPIPRRIASFFISIFLLADTSETVYFAYLFLFFFFFALPDLPVPLLRPRY